MTQKPHAAQHVSLVRERKRKKETEMRKTILAASIAAAALAAGTGVTQAADPGEYYLYHERYGSSPYGGYAYRSYPAYGYAPAYYGYGPSVGVSIGFGPSYRGYPYRYW